VRRPSHLTLIDSTKDVAALSDDDLAAAVAAGIAAFAAATDLERLAGAHTEHLGSRSPVALARRGLGGMEPGERAAAGRRVNEALQDLTAAYDARRMALEAERDERVLVEEAVDVTLPTDRRRPGARHPVNTVQDLLCDIFLAMGWTVAEGPEAESTWFNFDALNTPAEHPSRDLTDTFYVESADSGVVLRTQTSPVQIRAMLAQQPPIYIVCPGRVYRTDEVDATHSPVFHQLEGLAVDEGLSMAHLKGTLDHMAEQLFGAGVVTRFRPHYFPFTEPSAEMDLLCFVCHGESITDPDRPCRTCGNEGWIEWGGCGMVDPRVLTACGIDPQRYSGFAFGMGIDRALMFRSGAADMRDLFEGDVRFTSAFGGDA
jgi:phenylalanyl-tRNA synthetase alpha chain